MASENRREADLQERCETRMQVSTHDPLILIQRTLQIPDASMLCAMIL